MAEIEEKMPLDIINSIGIIDTLIISKKMPFMLFLHYLEIQCEIMTI